MLSIKNSCCHIKYSCYHIKYSCYNIKYSCYNINYYKTNLFWLPLPVHPSLSQTLLMTPNHLLLLKFSQNISIIVKKLQINQETHEFFLPWIF